MICGCRSWPALATGFSALKMVIHMNELQFKLALRNANSYDPGQDFGSLLGWPSHTRIRHWAKPPSHRTWLPQSTRNSSSTAWQMARFSPLVTSPYIHSATVRAVAIAAGVSSSSRTSWLQVGHTLYFPAPKRLASVFAAASRIGPPMACLQVEHLNSVRC